MSQSQSIEVKVVVMTFMKSTQGTHVYGEPNRAGKVFPTVYIQKSALPDPPPNRVKVTMEPILD